jgi:sugar porter (SP) family MFS transporter
MISAGAGDTTIVERGSGASLNFGYVWTISLVAALGGLLFGYDWVVIGGAAKFYEAYFELHDTAAQVAPGATAWAKIVGNATSPVGWAQSCALLGCLAGALGAGTAGDRFGRKPVLVVAAANFAVSSIGIAAVHTFTAFVSWRIVGGVSIGVASTISPMYISEIAPARIRGLLVAVNQLTIVLGILAAQLANWAIARPVPGGMSAPDFAASWNVQWGWRWMFAACLLPSALFLVAGLFVPESPRWLAKAGRTKRAAAVLARIGGPAYADAALADVARSLAGDARGAGLRDLLAPAVRPALVLGVVLAVFQQWCGINVIFNYAGEIFRQAGYDLNDAFTNIVITGVVNLIFTLVALFTVDRVGRKPLMLFGAAWLALTYTALGLCYHARAAGHAVPNAVFLILVLAAIGGYAMSLAPVTWVIISEIFPNHIRGIAMSVAVAALWVACFALTYTFPIFNAQLGPSVTFWIYATVCAAGFVYVAARLRETKGKTLEQIEMDGTAP